MSVIYDVTCNLTLQLWCNRFVYDFLSYYLPASLIKIEDIFSYALLVIYVCPSPVAAAAAGRERQ